MMVIEDDDIAIAYFGLILMLCSLAVEETRQRRWWVRPINAQRDERGAFTNIFRHMKMNDHEMFFKYTRMDPERFELLLSLVRPRLLKRSRRCPLSPEVRLAMTLKYLAHGGSFQNLSWEFRVGKSTVSKTILETCNAIWSEVQPSYVKFPEGKDWLDISEGFMNRWNFPHTLGAIDGKHVQLQCPMRSGTLFFNYKRTFSLVLLACCDADYKFIWADVGAYGSENDSSIFKRSVVGQSLEEGTIALPTPKRLPGSDIVMPYYFVADEAFPLKSCIMRPYPGKFLGEKKNIFNYRHSRARRTIENTFGILASRWRVYRQPLACSVPTAEAMVKATICLHNFLRSELCTIYSPPNLFDRTLESGEEVSGEWRTITRDDTNFRPVGRVGANVAPNVVYAQRDSLADYLVSPSGEVSWQRSYVNRGRPNTAPHE